MCYLSASKVFNKKGQPELQIIVSFCKPEDANTLYKERWQVETAFKGLKSSGFNIEDTHLTDLDRIRKYFSLVQVAITRVYKAGIYLDRLCPQKSKNMEEKLRVY
jgi:transposase